MTKDRGSYYSIDDVPASVDAELRQAAADLGVPLQTAVIAALKWGPLSRGILFGQLGYVDRAREYDAEPCVQIGVHVPRELKADIKDAAKRSGVLLGAVGRMVLIGLAGELKSVVQSGTIDAVNGRD